MRGLAEYGSKSGRTLSERDLQLLEALRIRCPVLTVGQAARTWWQSSADPHRAASKRLRKLAGGGLIQITKTVAHPELDLSGGPLFRWRPGDVTTPHWGQLSYRVQARWSQAPVAVECVALRDLSRSTVSHDIAVGTLYLHLRSCRPDVARGFVHESAAVARGMLGERASSRPDAAVHDGVKTTFVELVGAGSNYTAVGLARKHAAFCGVAYELW